MFVFFHRVLSPFYRGELNWISSLAEVLIKDAFTAAVRAEESRTLHTAVAPPWEDNHEIRKSSLFLFQVDYIVDHIVVMSFTGRSCSFAFWPPPQPSHKTPSSPSTKSTTNTTNRELPEMQWLDLTGIQLDLIGLDWNEADVSLLLTASLLLMVPNISLPTSLTIKDTVWLVTPKLVLLPLLLLLQFVGRPLWLLNLPQLQLLKPPSSWFSWSSPSICFRCSPLTPPSASSAPFKRPLSTSSPATCSTVSSADCPSSWTGNDCSLTELEQRLLRYDLNLHHKMKWPKSPIKFLNHLNQVSS